MSLSFRQNARLRRTLLEVVLSARGVVLALLIPLVHGCAGVPVATHPVEEFVDTREANSLIGSPKEDVIKRFGVPDWDLPGEKQDYLLYTARGEIDAVWDLFMPYLILPAEVYGDTGWEAIYCAIFELDKSGIVRQFESDSETDYRPPQGGEELLDFCLRQFKSDKQKIKADARVRLRDRAQLGDKDAAVYLANGFGIREPLTKHLDRDLGDPLFLDSLDTAKDTAYLHHIREYYRYPLDTYRKARLGDPVAQWDFYVYSPSREKLVWLCLAADKGHSAARHELGTLYLLGSDEYEMLEDVMVEPDIARACMWFNLSGRADISEHVKEPTPGAPVRLYDSPEVERTAKVMTETDLEEAEILVSRWEPGQCYRDLPRHKDKAPDQSLAALCDEADSGDFAARDELGRIYFLGTKGVESDLPRAYMWYRLAEEVYVVPRMRYQKPQALCDAMTPEERATAIKYLQQWQPGQCERNLLH